MNLTATKLTTTPALIDWNLMTRAEAFLELARRIGVQLRVNTDGKLIASGNVETSRQYLADIVARYRGEIIAHMLGLPEPLIETKEDVEREGESIGMMAQALDVAIREYCSVTAKPDVYRDHLLSVRRRMAPYLLVQNLCAFRCWLYEVNS